MVDGSFRESFHSIDFFCTQTLLPEDFEVIWVEYHDTVQAELEKRVAAYPNAKIIKLCRSDEYHSSYCFNAGIEAAQGEVLVIPDADVAVEPHFLETVWREHQTNEKLVMYVHRFNEEKEDHQAIISLEHLKRVARNTSWIGNLGGCITVRKKWLIQINGYEQHPVFGTGLHANGFDIYMRLRNLGMHIMWHPVLRLYHPWHPFTSIEGISYKLQHIVVHFRGFHLITNAYKGIDSSRDLAFPEMLQRELDEFEKSTRKKNDTRKGPVAYMKNIVKRLLSLLR